MTETADWIAVDWGTSRLRAWAMQGTRVLAQAESEDGMARLDPEGFEPALMALAGHWIENRPHNPPIDVVACGMVGARQGWIEAPYTAVPAPAQPAALVRVPGTSPRIRVWIVPGLKQDTPSDVMRGEETQIAGFVNQNPNWDGVICLPGTHTKWAQISAQEVVSFQTFMTGELFELLSKQSILRHTIGPGWDDTAFETSVNDMLARPERMATQLFSLRARDLLQTAPPGQYRAHLSGLLVGAELAAARPYWLGQPIVIIGAPEISATYATALKLVGAQTEMASVEAMTLAGLSAAHAYLKDHP